MKFNLFTASILSCSMLFATTGSQAVTVNQTGKVQASMTAIAEQPSPIEKALQQQRTERSKSSNQSFRAVTAIKTPPTQSFFATQNQHFSRFVQSLFYGNAS